MLKKQETTKLKKYADVYGSHLPMMLTIERNSLANMRRPLPLRSNFNGKRKIKKGLNISMGNYDRMDFTDFLGKNKAFDVDENLFRKVEKAYDLN